MSVDRPWLFAVLLVAGACDLEPLPPLDEVDPSLIEELQMDPHSQAPPDNPPLTYQQRLAQAAAVQGVAPVDAGLDTDSNPEAQAPPVRTLSPLMASKREATRPALLGDVAAAAPPAPVAAPVPVPESPPEAVAVATPVAVPVPIPVSIPAPVPVPEPVVAEPPPPIPVAPSPAPPAPPGTVEVVEPIVVAPAPTAARQSRERLPQPPGPQRVGPPARTAETLLLGETADTQRPMGGTAGAGQRQPTFPTGFSSLPPAGTSAVEVHQVDQAAPVAALAEAEEVNSDCPPAVVEPLSDIGGLTRLHRTCMEMTIGSSRNRALRNRLSLSLIANALALQDASWVDLVERHLDEIDGGNPSLALRLAVHHNKENRHEEALRLAGVALDHRADWPPQLYEDRTWVAYQVRTASTQALWRAEEEASPGGPAAERLRSETLEAAEAWAAFARHIERKSTVPERVCVAAGGEC